MQRLSCKLAQPSGPPPATPAPRCSRLGCFTDAPVGGSSLQHACLVHFTLHVEKLVLAPPTYASTQRGKASSCLFIFCVIPLECTRCRSESIVERGEEERDSCVRDACLTAVMFGLPTAGHFREAHAQFPLPNFPFLPYVTRKRGFLQTEACRLCVRAACVRIVSLTVRRTFHKASFALFFSFCFFAFHVIRAA